jgi:hypothetical protein
MKRKISNISPLVQNNANYLANVHKNGRRRLALDALIRNASDVELLCFVEICLNVLKGRVPLRKKHVQRMRTQADLLRRLSRSKCPASARRMLLTRQLNPQTGRGLPAVAGLLASVVAPMFVEKLLENK